jgi:ferredoxin
VTVDRARCTAVGICESHAPEIFNINDDNELEVAENIPEALEGSVRRAVSGCPLNALRFT